MNMWEIREDYDDYGRGFGMRSEVEEAYKEGCRHGYKKAMEEMQDGIGYRNQYPGTDMGERRFMPRYPYMGMREQDPYEDMGERRRRRSNGQYM